MEKETVFGSIRRNLTSSGRYRIRIAMMMELMKTDFPDPVVPATSIWGKEVRSAPNIFPSMSSPKGMVMPLVWGKPSLTSLKGTIREVELMTSKPEVTFPGTISEKRTETPPSRKAMSVM